MKKGVIAVILILVLVIIVSPGIVGKLAENSVDDNLNWAVDQSSGLIVTSQGFDRGWFSSEGQHRVELGDSSIRDAFGLFGDDAPALIIDTRLDHGLIPVSSMSREEGSLMPGLGSAVSTIHVNSADGDSFDLPGAIYSNVDLTGNLASRYVLEAGSVESGTGVANWEPGKITIAADPKSGSIEYDGDFGALSFNDAQESVTLDGLTFSGEQAKTEYGFFVGNLDLELGGMSVKSDNGSPQMDGLKGLSISASSSVDDGIVNAAALLNVDGQNMPGFGEVSFTADLSLTGADAGALGRVTQRLDELSGVQDPTQMMMMAEEDLQGLFASGFSFNFNRFDIALPMGLVESKMSLDIPESDPASFTWTSLLLSAAATVDLKVPEALVDMAMQMNPQMAGIVGMGYLKKNGDIYELSAEYKKALLTINGAPVPIPLGAFQ